MSAQRSTFVLIPGAGCDAWVWHLVVAELERLGHAAIAVELPWSDPAAGLPEYIDTVVAAIGDRRDITLVAQSLAGFIAPPVCARVEVRLLVLLNAMIPAPGETAGQWWSATGHAHAIADLTARLGPSSKWTAETLAEVFTHDLSPELAAESARHESEPAGDAFAAPCPLSAWPDVPTRVLAGRDDRLFPLEFQRRVARERLGLTTDELPGGHMNMLSQPALLAARLAAYRAELP